jgi:hypothetical protein
MKQHAAGGSEIKCTQRDWIEAAQHLEWRRDIFLRISFQLKSCNVIKTTLREDAKFILPYITF